MAGQYTKPDLYGLGRLAVMIEMFNRAPKVQLDAQIRKGEEKYGLSPLDRMRLQWEVARTEEAEQKRARPQSKPSATRDARKVLSMVR